MKYIGNLKVLASKEIEKSHISIGFECLDRDLFNPDKCYDLLAKTGVKYARCQTGWVKCEKQKGVYDFSWLDGIVDNLLHRGIIPWFDVGFGNPIYMKDAPNETAVGCVPLYYGEEVVEAWKNFVAELAKHYKDKVQHFEIWNESDSHHFWHPAAPDGAMLAKLVELTSKEIRKEIPYAKIGTNVSNGMHDLTRYQFIEDFLKNLTDTKLDFFCYHPYSRLPETLERSITYLRKLFDDNGFAYTELWNGEAGYPSWTYEKHWLIPEGCDDEHPQAVWQLRRYFLDLHRGVGMCSFFQIADMWEKPYAKASGVIAKPAAHGILNGKVYTPKKSYETISYLATFFSGDIKPSAEYFTSTIDGLSLTEQLSCVCMTFEKQGAPCYAYYLPHSVTDKFEMKNCFNAQIYRELKEPVLLDMYTGMVYEINNVRTPELGFTEYFGLPITNYPLVITEKDALELR